MSEPPRPDDAAPGLARRLLAQARPYWKHLAGIVALDVLAVPLALLAPLPLKIAIDSALGDRPLPAPLDRLGDAGVTALGMTTALAVAVGGLIAIALATELQKFLTWLLQSWTGEKLVL